MSGIVSMVWGVGFRFWYLDPSGQGVLPIARADMFCLLDRKIVPRIQDRIRMELL